MFQTHQWEAPLGYVGLEAFRKIPRSSIAGGCGSILQFLKNLRFDLPSSCTGLHSHLNKGCPSSQPCSQWSRGWVFFFLFSFYYTMCLCVYRRAGASEAREDRYSGIRVPGGCEPPSLEARMQTRVLCKRSECP